MGNYILSTKKEKKKIDNCGNFYMNIQKIYNEEKDYQYEGG